MGKKKLIVIWPYRFRDFDWQRFELDFLAPHVEIHVHELIDALTPEFGAAYANQSENPAVKRFPSLKEWRKEFKKISKDAIIFSHVAPESLKVLIQPGKSGNVLATSLINLKFLANLEIACCDGY